MFQSVDWDGLLADERLSAGDYEGLCSYLGGNNGDFAVCNEDGIVVYASGPGFAPLYTQGELECMWPYGDLFTIDAYEEPKEGGPLRYLLIRRSYKPDGDLEMMDILALNEAYQQACAFRYRPRKKVEILPQEESVISLDSLPEDYYAPHSITDGQGYGVMFAWEPDGLRLGRKCDVVTLDYIYRPPVLDEDVTPVLPPCFIRLLRTTRPSAP